MTRLLPFAALALASTAAFAQDKPAGTDLTAYSARATQRMMAADTDHDGKISKAEFAAALQARRAKRLGSRMFDRADTNHDGMVDQAELKALMARRFARLDANHDGVLTPDERHGGKGAADPE